MTTKDEQGWRELPLLLSLEEFCDWTGLHRNTVQKMVRSGAIKLAPCGGRRRYLKSELARMTGMKWRI